MKRKTLALIGCGNLGGLICAQYTALLRHAYELVAVYDYFPEKADAAAARTGAAACRSVEELTTFHADYVVEAVSPAVCRQVAIPVLESGSRLIVLSTGAFADTAFYDRAKKAARQKGVQIYFASGAIGGLDMMQAATLMGNVSAKIINEKPPAALNGAPFLQGRLLSTEREELLFLGSAREAIEQFPHNVNVAATLAIMTAGLDDTQVEIRSVPQAVANSHRIELDGAFGHASLRFESAPSKGNAKSSEIAAWSVTALLRRLQEEICF